jgi:hypothetical protein
LLSVVIAFTSVERRGGACASGLFRSVFVSGTDSREKSA